MFRHRAAARGVTSWISVVALAAVALSGCGTSASRFGPHLELTSEQAISLIYNQGIAHVPGGWILSGTSLPFPNTDLLVRTDEHFHVLAENRPAIPQPWRSEGYDHIGDIDVVGNVIYAPFEQPDYAKGYQATARFNATTLAFIGAVVLPQHQNSFVTVDPKTMIAYSMDEFDGDSLLRYDVTHDWQPLPPLKLSELLRSTQGASIGDGYIWISTSDAHNDLYRVSLASGKVTWIGHQGHPGGEGEGIDVSSLPSGYIHTMVVDPDRIQVWVENFDLTTG